MLLSSWLRSFQAPVSNRRAGRSPRRSGRQTERLDAPHSRVAAMDRLEMRLLLTTDLRLTDQLSAPSAANTASIVSLAPDLGVLASRSQPATTAAQALSVQPTVLATSSYPAGISTDSKGTVFDNYFQNPYGYAVQGLNPVTGVAATNPIYTDPNSGSLCTLVSGDNLPAVPTGPFSQLLLQQDDLLELATDGELWALDPSTGAHGMLLNVAAQAVDQTNVFDVNSGAFENDHTPYGDVFNPASATYGDVSVYETKGFTDIFVSALSNTDGLGLNYVERLHYVGGTLASADVVMDSNAYNDAKITTLGVAVNSRGIAVTSLPVILPTGTTDDVLVAFNEDLQTASDVTITNQLLEAVDAAADSAGNFWFTDYYANSIFELPGDVKGVADYTSIAPTAISVAPFNAVLNQQGIALSPDGSTIYLTNDTSYLTGGPDAVLKMANPLAPTITSVAANPEPVEPGENSLRLTPSGVTFPNPGGTQREVDYYRESNGIPGLQSTGTNQDTPVGTPSHNGGGNFGFSGNPADNFEVNVNTTGLAAGSYTYYAVANDGQYSSQPVQISSTLQSLPDLAPYTPQGWSAPIVLSDVKGGTIDTPLTQGQPIYYDAATINEGSAPAAASEIELVLDGKQIATQNNPALDPQVNGGQPQEFTDQLASALQTIAPGVHQLQLVIDPNNQVDEFKGDNIYTKIFSVAPAAAPAAGTWVAEGPSPIFGGQPNQSSDQNQEQFAPDLQFDGAIQAVAADPTNPDILYVGSVNGGIWKTTDATAPLPSWTPLTDDLPSLSIGALAFDPTDKTNQTLVAAIGSVSSDEGVNGPLDGVLRSTDGGKTWAVLGNAPVATTAGGSGGLDGESLKSVAARGQTILAAADNTWGSGAGDGLFRSTNDGQTFQLISGAAGSGLPAGEVSDLVGDPGDPNRFYAAVLPMIDPNTGVEVNGGIFRSDDAGAHWTDVTGGQTGAAWQTINTATNLGTAQKPDYIGVTRIHLE